jgi:hypothetical protein
MVQFIISRMNATCNSQGGGINQYSFPGAVLVPVRNSLLTSGMHYNVSTSVLAQYKKEE